MLERVFVAVDQFESRRSLVAFTAALAAQTGAVARVFHGREFVGRGCAAPLESTDAASLVVEEAVFDLRMSGVGADGLVRPCFNGSLAGVIVAEGDRWNADLIVLGSARHSRPARPTRRGVRRRVVLWAPVPVMVVARPDPNGFERRSSRLFAG